VEAREAFQAEGKEVDYRDVVTNSEDLDEMLAHSGGKRQVPVIVDHGKVTIGYGGT
jgi:glutaredoxin 3